jgi:hypothetical protein
MKRSIADGTMALLVLSLSLAAVDSAAAPPDRARGTSGAPHATIEPALPRDATRAIRRAEICHYLAGELGGDGSNRDREVNDALRRNRCSGAHAALERLKAKYRHRPAVVAKLAAAE